MPVLKSWIRMRNPFSMKQLPFTNQYLGTLCSKKLGSGSFGEIFLATHVTTGEVSFLSTLLRDRITDASLPILHNIQMQFFLKACGKSCIIFEL